MYVHILAVVGLGVLCAGWVAVQHWFAGRDPDQPGVEDRCGSCGTKCTKHHDHR
ncbi:MAG: hypothetical protein GF355_05315 [Candidatus Eisenbacteria bacterium]|nr:hypothetical protein [Candidatus Eisenbacteria bacterium]